MAQEIGDKRQTEQMEQIKRNLQDCRFEPNLTSSHTERGR